MAGSPIAAFVDALDRLDADAAAEMFADDGRLLCADGRRAEGAQAIRELLSQFLATLRSTAHDVTDEWQEGDVWIAEMKASYELRDWLRLEDLPRVVVLRTGPAGIADLRIYGAHEQRLVDHEGGQDGLRVGGRWLPSL